MESLPANLQQPGDLRRGVILHGTYLYRICLDVSSEICDTPTEMSLALGLKIRQGVVLSSDTRAILHPDNMNYAANGYSKLRLFGHCAAVAATGDVSLMARFLDQAEKDGMVFRSDESIAATVPKLEQFFWGLFTKQFLGDRTEHKAALLFALCGEFAGRSESLIYRTSIHDHFVFRPEPVSAAAGQHIHGGLYYLSRFRRDEMTMKEAAFLAYLCTREVGSLDPTVSPTDVQVVLCEPDGAKWMPAEWSSEFQARHERAVLQMRDWFLFTPR